MQHLPSNISLKSSHIYTFLDYKQAKDTCVRLCSLKSTSLLTCCALWSIILYTQSIILFYFDCLCAFTLALYHPSYTLYPKPHHLCAQVRSHCPCGSVAALVPPSAAWPDAVADGRQERGDITGMSFEMVRSSVYRAAPDESEPRGDAQGRGGGVGGSGRYVRKGKGGYEGACFGSQHLTYSTATVTWKDLLFICLPSFYLSFSIAPLIKDKKYEIGSRRGENERQKNAWTSAQGSVNGTNLYSPHFIPTLLCTRVCTYVHYVSVRSKQQSAVASFSLLTPHCYILLDCTAQSPHGDH